MIEEEIEHHALFGRDHRIFDSIQKGDDYLPIIILNRFWKLLSSPSAFLPPLPPPVCRCRVLFYALFNLLEPTKEDPESGAMPIH